MPGFEELRDASPASIRSLNNMLRWLFGKVQGGLTRAELSAELIEEMDTVDSSKLEDGSITADKIGTEAVGGWHIEEAAITNAHIQDLSAEKITAGDIAAERLQANVVDAVNLNASSAVIGSAKIGDLSATKITTDTLDANRIGAHTITADKLVTGTITAESALIANAAIDTAQIKTGAITTALIGKAVIGDEQIDHSSTNKLKVNDADIVSLTASKLTAGTIDAGVITVNNLNAENITTGTINGQRIGDGSITTSKIGADAVDNSKIADGAVKNENIFAGTITGDKLVVDAITAREIAAGSISTAELAANAITAGSGKIANAAITTALIGDAQITNVKIANLAVDNSKIASLDAGKITSGILSASTKLTVGTAGGARSEQYTNAGAPVYDYYDANGKKVRSDTPAGIDFFNADGTRASRIATTTQNITLSVGSGQTFSTIQAAIDSLPDIINHVVTIYLYAGNYGKFTISQKSGSGFMTVTTVSGQTVTVKDASVTNCAESLKIAFSNIAFVGSSNVDSVDTIYVRNSRVDLSGITISGATIDNYAVFYTGRASGVFTGCSFTAKNTGVLVSEMSEVKLMNCTGTDVSAQNAIVFDGGGNTFSGGTAAWDSSVSGVIVPEHGLKASGLYGTMITGLPGTWDHFASWGQFGDLVDSGYSLSSLLPKAGGTLGSLTYLPSGVGFQFTDANSNVFTIRTTGATGGGSDLAILQDNSAGTPYISFNPTTHNVAIDGTSTGGKWNKGHLAMGPYHLWVDASNRLRIKNGAPTSDTDGTVVGTQA